MIAARVASRAVAVVAPAMLSVAARTLSGLPSNDLLWSYPILGRDGSPYLTRVVGPRVHGRRLIAHQIWRPDADRDPHRHPWRRAVFRVVSGGYTEERLVDGRLVTRVLSVGDVNVLDADDYHRIVSVSPNTCTVGLVGERCQEWGFWVAGEGFVPKDVYFARTGYTPPASLHL